MNEIERNKSNKKEKKMRSETNIFMVNEETKSCINAKIYFILLLLYFILQTVAVNCLGQPLSSSR